MKTKCNTHTHTHTHKRKFTAEQIAEWNKRQLEINFEEHELQRRKIWCDLRL